MILRQETYKIPQGFPYIIHISAFLLTLVVSIVISISHSPAQETSTGSQTAEDVEAAPPAPAQDVKGVGENDAGSGATDAMEIALPDTCIDARLSVSECLKFLTNRNNVIRQILRSTAQTCKEGLLAQCAEYTGTPEPGIGVDGPKTESVRISELENALATSQARRRELEQMVEARNETLRATGEELRILRARLGSAPDEDTTDEAAAPGGADGDSCAKGVLAEDEIDRLLAARPDLFGNISPVQTIRLRRDLAAGKRPDIVVGAIWNGVLRQGERELLDQAVAYICEAMAASCGTEACAR